MERGNLVIYDLAGTIISQSGEATGDLLPHSYPVGVPYMEIPYGTMNKKILVKIDTSTDPHTPIFEDLILPKTPEETIFELQAEIIRLKNSSL